MEKISVIVPAYNAEKTIKRCLKSILGGGYSDLEVIVINNGSTDDTEKIVKEIASTDKRVLLHTQENQGPAGSRDTGLKNASGKYIAFCDSDDWYEPDFLEFLYNNLIKYDADIVLCRAQIPGKNDTYDAEKIWIWNKEEAIDAFLEHKLLNGVLWNKLIKKELFNNIEFDRTLWYWEDLDVVWKILKKAKKVVRFNKAKYNFFVHPESMCAKKYSEKRIYASLKVWNKIVEDCKGTELKSHYNNAVAMRYGWLLGDLILMLKDNYDNKKDTITVQKILRETGNIGRSRLSGFYRIYAWICEKNLHLAKIIRKIKN